MLFDIVSAVVGLVLVLLIVILGDMYLKMDKHRTRALMLLKKLLPHFDMWLESMGELFSTFAPDDRCGKFEALVDEYRSLPKKKLAEKATIVNRIHDLAQSMAASHAKDPRAREVAQKIRDNYYGMGMLLTEYNNSVQSLNNLIRRKIFSSIASALRVRPMSMLNVLTIL